MKIVEVVGCDKAVEHLYRYNRRIEEKIPRFVEELAQIGLEWLDVGIASYKAEEYESSIVSGGSWVAENVFAISLTGADVTFFEFGTGVYQPPYQDEATALAFGAIRGEYGRGWGKRRAWFYYDSSHNKVEARGFQTDHNLYGSAREMRHAIEKVVREVF